MKKIFASKVAVTLLGGAICLIILFFAYRYRVNKKINPISVPYAKTKLEARTLIQDEHVCTVKIAGSMVTEGVVRDKSQVIGKYVNYNTFIPAGSLFYSSSIITWDQMPDSAWSDLPDGNTVVYLSASDATVGSFIYPGDKIDLYYKTYVDNKLVYGKLIEGITVLAVKDGQGNHIFKKTESQKDFGTLIFSLNEDMFLLFRKTSIVGGDIIPVTRSSEYCKDCSGEVSSEYLRSLIESQVDNAVQDNASEEEDTKVVE